MRLFVATLALCVAPLAVAQPRLLVVEGAAEIVTPPDIVTITFRVETEGRDGREVFADHEREVARALAAVRAFRVPDSDIEIRQLTLRSQGRDTQAIRVISIETDSLRIVPDLVAAIVDSGVDQIQEVQYGLSRPDAAADRALAAAAARAREKALQLAVSFDAQLGPVRAVLESGIVPPQGLNVRGGRGGEVAYYVDGMRVTGGAYATGSQAVSARVVVEYELVPLDAD